MTLLGSSAAGAATCGSMDSIYFEGEGVQQGINGAQATVNHQDPEICTSGDDGQTSAAWVLVAHSTSNPDTDLAQEGYVKLASWSTSNPYWFWECENCKYTDGSTAPSGPQQYGGQLVQNPSNTSYTDQYSTFTDSSGDIHLRITPVNDPNGTQEVAILVPQWSLKVAEWSGEVHNPQSYMPGSESSPETYTYVQTLNGSTWTYVNTETAGRVGPNDGDTVLTRTALAGFTFYDTRG